MKSLNAKKIVAFAGAALLLGAAVAAADVTYGTTQLIDQSGQPTVKIYVGSKAAVSDGVAAANIAAKIANEAYKTSTLTAGVTGTPTCIVGAGVNGAGSCSITESSKKVTLQVTLPGTLAGTHTFKTLIGDTIDRTLQNRNNALSEDVYSATTDTSGSVTSPLRAVETGSKGLNLYKIGAGQFTGFADYSVVDNQASSTSYTEEQSFWIGSQPNAVAYDSSSSIKDVAVNKYSAMAYSAKFTGNDNGISVCTSDLINDTSNWASCGIDSLTAKHRVGIKFMGGDWIISEMTPASTANPSSTAVVAGGQIKLAKEAKYGIINVGQELDAGSYKIRLADISVATGKENDHPAIIDILDANDAVIGQAQVMVGDTYTFNSNGASVKIHVYATAPGFTLNSKWAEMAIYTDEITLKDGGRYNLVSSTDADKNFKVSLLWKNKDYTSSTDSTVADSLREIVIYNVDGFDEKTVTGDTTTFLKSKPTFKVTYSGVDLKEADYAPLTYNAQSKDTYRVANIDGDVSCGATSSLDSSYVDAKLIEIKTNGGQLLGGTGDVLSGDYTFEKVLFDPIGITGAGVDSINGTQNQSTAVGSYVPKILYKINGRDCYNWNKVTPGSILKFDTAGDNSAAQGAIYFTSTGFGSFGDVSMIYQEDAGKYGTASNNLVYTGVPVLTTDTSLSTFRFKATDSSTQNVYYKGLGASTFTGYEPTFVSERGSKTTSVGTSDVRFNVAKAIAQPTFQFAYADNAIASSAGDVYIVGVGDSKVFGGVTVKVAAIDATAGSCSVIGPGGAPVCTVDSTGVSGVISPTNAASVQVSQPYKLDSDMVMLDTQGAKGGVSIIVGGPEVNTMATGTDINFATEGIVVKEMGSKIIVAGYSADQTTAAAAQFIAGIKRQ